MKHPGNDFLDNMLSAYSMTPWT